MIHGVLRVLCGLLCLLFVFSVAVQYNDPDPVRWMAIYAAAAIVCGRAAWGKRTPVWVPIAVAVVALVWAAIWAPGVWGRFRFSELFAEFEMKSTLIEEAREMCGLLIVAGGMLVALLTSATRPTQGAPK